MAISKILCIGSCGSGYPGKHLRQALDYITAPEKTGNGEWVAALNCQKDDVYGQMRRTKAAFGKLDKRQGYHLIISFVEGEVDAGTAFEIIGKFADEYLAKDFEALYAVHDNTEHIHGHVVFNSVSFRDGRKYRYEKGDWAEKIQPVVNRLCGEYGLSTIDISPDMEKKPEKYKEWNDSINGSFLWKDMIKRDIDACILQSPSYESFLSMLSGLGYAVKNAYERDGKYLSIKPAGMARFKRCKSLGADYTRERIRERILTENLSQYRPESNPAPKIMWCRVKRCRRTKMSGIQKRYFARLYRTGLLKKRPYSQAWKYLDDIRMMKKLQEDYLFLNKYHINSTADLSDAADSMRGRKKEASHKRRQACKERARFRPLFDAADEMRELQECENCYSRGGTLFEPEHQRWQELNRMLSGEGYTPERMESLRQHFDTMVAAAGREERKAACEERTAARILKECMADSALRKKEERSEAAPHQEMGGTAWHDRSLRGALSDSESPDGRNERTARHDRLFHDALYDSRPSDNRKKQDKGKEASECRREMR
ncbi:MAG: relaxase/mobilization nuclease domain-containing protein [Lachnospiraceae bacterium]|nr:relaxase/mobilization nuclease domain-containing protein [Lachnospiraceae bacterium]